MAQQQGQSIARCVLALCSNRQHTLYHYCRKNRDRSDTILSFDALSPFSEKPLLWEYHGEHKAKFKARPYRWTPDTRENIYNSCKVDVLSRPANQFRRPAKDAVLTWPPDPKLSKAGSAILA